MQPQLDTQKYYAAERKIRPGSGPAFETESGPTEAEEGGEPEGEDPVLTRQTDSGAARLWGDS
ncbi:hypothetical protein EYF80_044833 [Liparis tanakae]|uniref:Uncharacterized protein n=1 Tax=Liparis tanakae TaxID=230148 RepID=A0A4Z2FUY1_9TELE|nr:hypothetical protein EYF80_044833 [Liparis tanakae]